MIFPGKSAWFGHKICLISRPPWLHLICLVLRKRSCLWHSFRVEGSEHPCHLHMFCSLLLRMVCGSELYHITKQASKMTTILFIWKRVIIRYHKHHPLLRVYRGPYIQFYEAYLEMLWRASLEILDPRYPRHGCPVGFFGIQWSNDSHSLSCCLIHLLEASHIG